MCTTCGCGMPDGRGVSIDGSQTGEHVVHTHTHVHAHDHTGHGDETARLITLEADLLAKNATFAEANRRAFGERGVFVVNLVSAPGSGKTTLLVRTTSDLREHRPIAVIEGDQQTSRDAERIRETGVPAIQINTGKICHLDAHMVGHAVERLELPRGTILFIENVGNLVCPASFDLGEHHKVVLVSTTEGEDKPLKYPDMFAAADLMVVNKTDLLPYLEFDVERCVDYARRINPDIAAITLSATEGGGLDHWYDWLDAGAAHAVEASPLTASPTVASE